MHGRGLPILMISTLALGVSAAVAQVAPSPVESRLQHRFDELQQDLGFPGATAAVVFPDGTVATVATGWSDIERRITMKPTDRMLSGSVGKSFVAALALHLAERDALDLDAPIAPLLANETWFERIANAESLTTALLLGHRSGLREYLENPSVLETLRQAPQRAWSVEERMSGILDEPAESRPGESFHYADTNYILAGLVLDRAGGAPFYDQLAELLQKAGLSRTGPSNRAELPGLVPGYSANLAMLGLEDLVPSVELGGRPLARVVDQGRYVFNPQLEWTGGGLVTTSEDLARWARALFRGEIVTRASVDRLVAGNRYGLGTQIRHSGYWGPTYGHSGWMPGYQSAMEYFPEHDIAVAVQVNTDDTDLVEPRHLLFEIMRIAGAVSD